MYSSSWIWIYQVAQLDERWREEGNSHQWVRVFYYDQSPLSCLYFFQPVTFDRELVYLSVSFVESCLFFFCLIILLSWAREYLFRSLKKFCFSGWDYGRMKRMFWSHLYHGSRIRKNVQYYFRFEFWGISFSFGTHRNVNKRGIFSLSLIYTDFLSRFSGPL